MSISNSERDIDQDFLMPVEDVFSISGRGTVVTGRIEKGTIKLVRQLKSLDSLILKQLQLLVLRCSEKKWSKVKLVTTVVSY